MSHSHDPSKVLLIGIVWGLSQFVALSLSFALENYLGNAYFVITRAEVQLSLILVPALAFSFGLVLKDVGIAVRALIISQFIAFLAFVPFLFAIVNFFNPSLEAYFGLVLFLASLVSISFILGLVGSAAGSLFGEWNSRRKIKPTQGPPSLSDLKTEANASPSPGDPWKELMEKKRKEAEDRLREQQKDS